MGYLESITGPRDLRGLDDHQLAELASEIRDFLVTKVSRTGGHLGPNLGVVELTMAIHRVFDSPTDRVIFDSVSEIRLLSQGSLRYRRQVLALKNFLSLQNCTTLFLDDLTQQAEETSLHSMVHGVVRLHQTALQFGGDRRPRK